MDNKKKELMALETQLWPENNKKNKHYGTKIAKVVIVIACFVSTFVVGYNIGTTRYSSDSTNKMDDVYNLVKNKWFFGSEYENLDEDLITQAIKGLLTSSYDKHSSYFSASEMEEFTNSVNSEFVGIGVMYATIGGEFIITNVFADSPAYQAGLLKGDIITYVDGTDVTTIDKDTTLKDLVLGEPGTIVTIKVLRDGQEVSFDVTRQNISTVVNGEIIDNNVGLLSVYSFGSETVSKAQDRLDEFVNAGVTDLIIDLRNDGGGYLTSIVDLASLFIPKDYLAVETRDKDGNSTPYYASGNNYTQFENIVLLINENTASAAEAFTLSLKQNLDNVTIVGARSYGKGTVQDTYSLGDGSYLKLTTAKWYSPAGDNIDQVGITPDYEIAAYAISDVSLVSFEQESQYGYDTVSDQTKTVQQLLQFLGYDINRTDGYMNQATLDALKQYAMVYELSFDNTLNKELYDSIKNKTLSLVYMDDQYDQQLQQALQLFSND